MARTQRRFRWLQALPVLALLAGSAAFGQAAMPPSTVEDALHGMSDRAGVIFAGQVIAVRRKAGGDDASGFVEVEFRVDQAIRGSAAGTPYILREWAGLWAGGAQRYRVGERLLMFLRTPGASGLSSPVDGMDGAIPIHGAAATVASGFSVQYPVADLRWVGAELLRPVSYRAESAHSDHRSRLAVPFLDARPMVRALADGAESATVSVKASASTADHSGGPSRLAQQEPVESVIGTLRVWQKAHNAAR
jgi:hypothetical protein